MNLYTALFYLKLFFSIFIKNIWIHCRVQKEHNLMFYLYNYLQRFYLIFHYYVLYTNEIPGEFSLTFDFIKGRTLKCDHSLKSC